MTTKYITKTDTTDIDLKKLGFFNAGELICIDERIGTPLAQILTERFLLECFRVSITIVLTPSMMVSIDDINPVDSNLQQVFCVVMVNGDIQEPRISKLAYKLCLDSILNPFEIIGSTPDGDPILAYESKTSLKTELGVL